MKQRLAYLMAFLICATFVFGQYPEPLNPPRFLNNFSATNFLTKEESLQIEQLLDRFEQETSNEICIVVVDDINNDEPWHYAAELAEKWGVGKPDKDNGILFLIKPTQENGGHQVYIEVGRGLEGAIPDITCQEIIDNEVLPQFKEGQYAKGIAQACQVLIKLAKGEYNKKSYRKQHQNNPASGLIGLVIILVILYILIKRGGGGTTIGRTGGSSFFYFGGYRGGGFGGGGFGSGGFGGGSSGGGFGGFGGGSFGGGGAGGSW
ncbi:MAG: hypothetical protein RLZZ301_1249 [Bacteroidota bacterium]|jgi:uncharacterized protein